MGGPCPHCGYWLTVMEGQWSGICPCCRQRWYLVEEWVEQLPEPEREGE